MEYRIGARVRTVMLNVFASSNCRAITEELTVEYDSTAFYLEKTAMGDGNRLSVLAIRISSCIDSELWQVLE